MQKLRKAFVIDKLYNINFKRVFDTTDEPILNESDSATCIAPGKQIFISKDKIY